MSQRKLTRAQVLGIDERVFARKKGYATTHVGLRNHKVFDVVRWSYEVSLRGYSWLEPIVRMWRFSKPNGITEGFRTKIGDALAQGVPLQDFENYRMRVLAQCGWNGVINRV